MRLLLLLHLLLHSIFKFFLGIHRLSLLLAVAAAAAAAASCCLVASAGSRVPLLEGCGRADAYNLM